MEENNLDVGIAEKTPASNSSQTCEKPTTRNKWWQNPALQALYVVILPILISGATNYLIKRYSDTTTHRINSVQKGKLEAFQQYWQGYHKVLSAGDAKGMSRASVDIFLLSEKETVEALLNLNRISADFLFNKEPPKVVKYSSAEGQKFMEARLKLMALMRGELGLEPFEGDFFKDRLMQNGHWAGE